MLLHNRLKKYRLILGSASPRRKLLLEGMGLTFEIITADTDETVDENLMHHDAAIEIAKNKAIALIQHCSASTILITADTIVCLENKIIGKPQNKQEAVSILSQLSGNRHTVITAVCITTNEMQRAFYVGTDVYLKKLNTEEIDYYIDNYKPYDKAGAYGIQEWIGFVALEKIHGSYHNVMGLPTSELYVELNRFIS